MVSLQTVIEILYLRLWNAVTQGGDWGFLVSFYQRQNECIHVERFWLHFRSRGKWQAFMGGNTSRLGILTCLCEPRIQFSLFESSSILSRGPPPSITRPRLLFSHLLSYIPFFGYTAREKEGLARTEEHTKLGQGYMAAQSTKPQTLGYGLADSPVGLLAWIYEKLIVWTDAYPWEDDEGAYSILTYICRIFDEMSVSVLTWISIYHFSRAGPTASLRIYYEYMHHISSRGPVPTNIPVGYSYVPKELFIFPQRYVC